MIDPVQLKEALVELGDNSEEIYDKLKIAGIKGRKNSTISCPINAYLTKKFPDAVAIYTSWGYCSLYNALDQFIGIVNPLAVAAFIARFDNDDFPDLVEQE